MKLFTNKKPKRNVFEIDFGNGIEVFTYDELNQKFLNMDDNEKKSFYEKNDMNRCKSLITITIPETLLNSIK